MVYPRSSSGALTFNPVQSVLDHTLVFHAKQLPLQGSIPRGIPET